MEWRREQEAWASLAEAASLPPASVRLGMEPAQRSALCREGVRGLWVTLNLALLSPCGCPGRGSGPLWAPCALASCLRLSVPGPRQPSGAASFPLLCRAGEERALRSFWTEGF